MSDWASCWQHQPLFISVSSFLTWHFQSDRSLPAAWEAAVTPEGEVFYAEPQSPAAVRVPAAGSSNSSIAAGGGGDYATSVAGHPSAAPAPTASTSGKLRNLLRRRRSQKSPRDRAPQLTAVLQQGATAGEDAADGEVSRTLTDSGSQASHGDRL